MADSVHASAISSTAVTPSDSTAIEFKALYIGGSGNVTIKHYPNDTAVAYVGVTPGMILPVESKHGGGLVMATGTTATNIVAMNW